MTSKRNEVPNAVVIIIALLGFFIGMIVSYFMWGYNQPIVPEVEAQRQTTPYATYSSQCGEITMSFHNPTPWLFVFDYRVDGEAVVSQSPWAGLQFNSSSPLYPGSFGDRWHLVPVDGNRNQDITLTFGEDTGVHSVGWRLAEGAEQDYYIDWTHARVQSDCQPPQPTTRMCHWDGQAYEAIAVTRTARARHFNAHKEDKDWLTGMDADCEFPPTPTPTPSVTTSNGGSTSMPGAPAGRCAGQSDPVITQAVATRSGTSANIAYVPTAGESEPVNVVFDENPFEIILGLGSHGLRDWTPNNGNVQLNDLVEGQSYWYRIANGCSPWSGIFFIQ